MAETYKPLAQSLPSGGTLTTLYTTPGATSAVVSTLNICNLNLFEAHFRVSVAIAGAADAESQYLYYDEILKPSQTVAITTGYTLATTDVIRVYSHEGRVSFTLFGLEIT